MKLVLVIVAAAAVAQELPWRQSAFAGEPVGWTRWAAREEIGVRAWVDTVVSRGGSGSLAVSGNSNAAGYGGWTRVVGGIQAGRWYRFTAYYTARSLRHENLEVVARLDWQTAAARRAGQPEYAWRVTREGAWRKLTVEAPAPKDAAAVVVQLFLQNAPQATVWWDDLTLEEIAAPGPRNAVVAAVNLRPQSTGAAAVSVQQFIDLADSRLSSPVDLILLPEGITVVGTGKKYADVAEPLPGPTTEKLGGLARRKKAWVVAGVYERDGVAIYNTAVVIDREGRLAGTYRKVYVPREEIEGGLTPGNDYPVFDTDFGRVGVMICWDIQYADPARALARRGAELSLVPIWGGNEELGKARAIENHLFVATSGYNYPTYVMDPAGEIVARAPQSGSIAVATIDLNRRYADPWLGNMRARFMKEVRSDLPTEP